MASLPRSPRTTASTWLLLIALGLWFMLGWQPQPSHAARAEDWQAGNIMSDAAFTHAGSMSVDEIQHFLDQKIGHCDIWGTGIAHEFGSHKTRADYARARGWAGPPYTCLNRYHEVPKTSPTGGEPANNYAHPDAIPHGAKSAAWIIKDAAERYGISPKVLLVKIATESSGPLTSDSWPLFNQYRYAMGSHCPDSGPGGSANCDTRYAGFSIQMYSAAELMRWYIDNMDKPWWSYKKPHQTNHILWNVVQRGCGGSDVYIHTRATAALYTYTPYQPNQAALRNMYGTGDNCSAYGNRNFWRVYWDWFGDSRSLGFMPLAQPRLMQITTATYKRQAFTGHNHTGDGLLQPGRILKITSKIPTSDGWCLRTASDTQGNIPNCIPAANIGEIAITPTPLTTQPVRTLMRNLAKTNLRTGEPAGDTIGAGRIITFSHQVRVNGTDYLISQVDSQAGRELGVPISALAATPEYQAITPRTMAVTHIVKKQQGATNTPVGQELPVQLTRTFVARFKLGNTWYYQTEADHALKLDFGIAEQYLKPQFSNFSQPRWMSVSRDTQAVNPLLNHNLADTLKAGEQRYFTSKIVIGDTTFYRTKEDSDAGRSIAWPAKDIADISYQPFAHPRHLRLRAPARKVDTRSLSPVGQELPAGLTRRFSSKVLINGSWYYRTETDEHQFGLPHALPASSLEEVR